MKRIQTIKFPLQYILFIKGVAKLWVVDAGFQEMVVAGGSLFNFFCSAAAVTMVL